MIIDILKEMLEKMLKKAWISYVLELVSLAWSLLCLFNVKVGAEELKDLFKNTVDISGSTTLSLFGHGGVITVVFAVWFLVDSLPICEKTIPYYIGKMLKMTRFVKYGSEAFARAMLDAASVVISLYMIILCSFYTAGVFSAYPYPTNCLSLIRVIYGLALFVMLQRIYWQKNIIIENQINGSGGSSAANSNE